LIFPGAPGTALRSPILLLGFSVSRSRVPEVQVGARFDWFVSVTYRTEGTTIGGNWARAVLIDMIGRDSSGK